MPPQDLLCLVLVLAALQPVVQRVLLLLARRWHIAGLERRRGSRVLLLVQREETFRVLGIPLRRELRMESCEDVLRAIHLADRERPIDLIVHTPPGRALAALQIARALRAHPARVTVFVPYHAMSGATLIALAADEIAMCPHAVLGPVDPQFGRVPAAALIKVAGQKSADALDDATLVLADIGRRAVGHVREAARELLHGHLPAHQAEALAKLLSTGRWTHEHPISHSLAKELGLPVSSDLPAEVLQLLRLYPAPGAGAGLEYAPATGHTPTRTATETST